MQYIIMNYTPPADHPDAQSVRDAADGEVWGAYTKALVEAGILVGGEALHPSATATTLRVRDGSRDVQDGPYADTKEQLGGFYVIDVPDLDTALEWAARNPAAASGAVEVRPVITRSQ
ncbi:MULTISPECIES: YciI family protein [unclassified Roseitalea]|uniref:YciI family protein n=1 Tax=unclassified Roseitalea TaxID=2639107 RepID=UPI00273D3E59|nr:MULTISPECIES: YciI family protein [unclassified Roseitalea]